MKNQLGIVIPCYQAAKLLPRCLPPLLQSPLKPRVLIIDSSSTDGTVEIAKKMGAETLVIPKHEFNHGTTRERGRHHLNTSLVVMMTQDAFATSIDMLNHLITPLVEQKASISYARQLPHNQASIFAAFPRQFNYPIVSHIRSLADVERYGAYTFFCSNSCAAYLNSALDEIEGFSPVLFGEDTIAVAKLLHRGHRIAYVAEATVHHSHDYTLRQEFQRHYAMGLTRKVHQELFAICGSDSKRGKAYVQALLTELWRNAPMRIPYALLQTFVKYTGYCLGRSQTIVITDYS